MPPASSPQSARRALLALLLIVPAPSIGSLMAFMIAPGTTIGSLAYALGKTVLYVLPVIWLLLIDRQRLSWSKPLRGGFGVAAALGLAIGAAILAVFHFFAEARIDAEQIRTITIGNGLSTPMRYVAACAWLALGNSLLEEYAFRWFIFEKFRAIMPPMAAVVASALAFTAHHVIVVKAFFAWDITLLASFGVFAGGLIWSWCYNRYQSIWPGYVSHIVADIALFIIGWKLIFGG